MRKHPALVVVFGFIVVLAGLVAPVLPVFGAFSWEVQVVDAKADLQGISLALDSHGNPHMVYCATESGNSFSGSSPEYLTYASWDGLDWNTQIVDNKGFLSLSGARFGYSSFTFDSNDTPHIVYSTIDHGYIKANENDYTFHCLVEYATWTGTHWSIMTVDSGVGGSIVVDSKGNPHIAYADNNGLLKYASWTGLDWAIQFVDSDFLRPQKTNGEIISSQYLTLDANDNPCIVYGDESTVKVAMGSSFGWSIQTVLSGELLHLGNIAVDSYGYPHFTCIMVLNGSIMYESWNGTAWFAQRVTDRSYTMSGTFVKLDSRDIPHITYIAVPACTVYYAVWNGSGWDTQTVDQHSYISDCAPFVLDFEGNPHICYLTGRGTGDSHQFYADGTATYATSNQPTPTPSPTVPELTPWNTLPVLILTAFVIAVLKKTTKKQTFRQARGRILSSLPPLFRHQELGNFITFSICFPQA